MVEKYDPQPPSVDGQTLKGGKNKRGSGSPLGVGVDFGGFGIRIGIIVG